METKDRASMKPVKNHANGILNGAKSNSSNGKAKTSEGEAKPSEAPAKPEPAQAGKVVRIARADDRLSKFEQFQKLGERFTFLKQKDRELKNFTISQDDTAAKVVMQCKGAELVITNDVIISKMVTMAQGELDRLVMKTEKEILDFQI